MAISKSTRSDLLAGHGSAGVRGGDRMVPAPSGCGEASLTEPAPAPVDLDREAFELALRAGAVARPTVDVILVTRNSRSDLERCFASLEAAARYAGARILVADNGSDDGSLEFCLGRPAGLVEGVALLEDRGFATAMGAAVGFSSADYVVLAHPDVLVAEEAIVSLVDHLEGHPTAAAAAPRIVGADGAVPSAGSVPNVAMLLPPGSWLSRTRWGRRHAARAARAPLTHPQGWASVEWASSELLCVRRGDVVQDGVLPRAAAPRFADIDLGVRLRRAGRQIHYLSGIEVVRDRGGAGTAASMSGAIRLYARWPRYALRGVFGDYRRQRTAEAARRAIDVAVSATLLLVLAPILAAAALLVAIESGGPVLFRQQRLGRGRVPFTIYKLRTMRQDAEALEDEQHVLRHLEGAPEGLVNGRAVYKAWPDPRVTRVGAQLRRWSIDELPQLVNVLRGDMTLVGFRPPLPREVAHYPQWYHGRFDLKPGLTGLWQVSGRNERSYEEMVIFDLAYATRRSLALDIALLARTPLVVMQRRGAV